MMKGSIKDRNGRIAILRKIFQRISEEYYEQNEATNVYELFWEIKRALSGELKYTSQDQLKALFEDAFFSEEQGA